ncbi:MAG TPA: hypothetical protein PLU35_09950 [Phycisphaerales bacterium]|nr:hypothetical protein [Phycisphaerales bacterium]
MTIDLDEQVERDDLAPAQRLRIIAEILAEGVRRRRDDNRRMGEIGPHQEREFLTGSQERAGFASRPGRFPVGGRGGLNEDVPGAASRICPGNWTARLGG